MTAPHRSQPPKTQADDPYNPWQYKPKWCQPWSILLTGAIAIFLPAWLTHSFWLTAGVALPVSLWWGYFLILWPRLLRQHYQAIAESTTPHTPQESQG
ncbi:MAG: DUF6737 family protein [Jaaginema sp. PMC 1079.18]|nr:DUF6737 family protein [Jaaginema sp. PMC 1080.18]MEC4850588.1 DUF6737 family protein [Jaaginema sp. PMC 1079.18]MEC4867080.1 DUF6737 family protein [Jaaginema sp. PMC 1078.18]